MFKVMFCIIVAGYMITMFGAWADVDETNSTKTFKQGRQNGK